MRCALLLVVVFVICGFECLCWLVVSMGLPACSFWWFDFVLCWSVGFSFLLMHVRMFVCLYLLWVLLCGLRLRLSLCCVLLFACL